MSKIVCAVAFPLAPMLPARAFAAHFDTVYPKISVDGDPRERCFLAVPDLAMKKAGADYTVRSSDEDKAIPAQFWLGN